MIAYEGFEQQNNSDTKTRLVMVIIETKEKRAHSLKKIVRNLNKIRDIWLCINIYIYI